MTLMNHSEEKSGEHNLSIGFFMVSYIVAGLIVLVPIVALLLGRDFGAWIYPYLSQATTIAIAIVIFVILPISVFRGASVFGGMNWIGAGNVVGALGWSMSVMLVWDIWGIVPALIGIFVAGVLVVPMAVVATLVNGYLGEAALIAGSLVFWFFSLGLGASGTDSQ